MDSAIIMSLLTLTFLEIVLGIDNVIFISIITERIKEEEQKKAMSIGMALAMGIRLVLLLGISFILELTKPLFALPWMHEDMTGKGVILLIGGVFLMYSSTKEIYQTSEGDGEEQKKGKVMKFGVAIFQIVLINLVFSFDSILTAVGLTDIVWVMAVGIIVSTIVMILFAKKVSEFIKKHKSLKVLALSFLLMIGLFLVLESAHIEVPKGYIYAAITFSLFVEFINIKKGARKSKGQEV